MSGQVAPVIPIAPMRRFPCPHCDRVMRIRDLDPHIDVCPVLVEKSDRGGPVA